MTDHAASDATGAVLSLTHHRQDVLFALVYLDGQLQACTPGAEDALSSASAAVVHELEIALPGGPSPSGRIVLGLNPRCPFDAGCQAFIGPVAHQFAGAVARERELVDRVGNLEPVLAEIIEAAMAIAGADCGSIQLLDSTTGELRIAAHRGFDSSWVEYWNSVTAARGSCGTAVDRGERVIVEDVTTSPLFAGTPALDVQLRAGVRAVQSTRLVSRSGRALGMFSTHYRKPHRPDERTLRLLDLLARQAADIVERAYSEAALRDSEERLRAADRRKDEFLATLAHELRNPLAPIRTGLELIRLAGSLPVAVERVRAVMERQIGHMVHLIDDLLDISRITSGKIELQRQLLPLSELVEGAVEATRTILTERRMTLDVRLPEAPCPLDVDRTRFVQVLSNLLHNAAKFSPPGGLIEVSANIATIDDADRRELLLTVADRGIGIAPELMPRVFDLFSQGEGMAGQGGLGIGLALVRRLVELHGGHVEAHSEVHDRGTQIVIRMPLSEVVPPVVWALRDDQAKFIACRVLIVDDTPGTLFHVPPAAASTHGRST